MDEAIIKGDLAIGVHVFGESGAEEFVAQPILAFRDALDPTGDVRFVTSRLFGDQTFYQTSRFVNPQLDMGDLQLFDWRQELSCECVNVGLDTKMFRTINKSDNFA